MAKKKPTILIASVNVRDDAVFVSAGTPHEFQNKDVEKDLLKRKLAVKHKESKSKNEPDVEPEVEPEVESKVKE